MFFRNVGTITCHNPEGRIVTTSSLFPLKIYGEAGKNCKLILITEFCV
jgi:hypothetical protein